MRLVLFLMFLALYCAALGAWVRPDVLRDDQAWVPYLFVTVGMTALFFIGTLCLKRKGRPGETLLHPPVFMTGWSLFMVCLPGFLAFSDPELLAELEGTTPISYAYATYGMVLVLSALVFLWFGYVMGLRLVPPFPALRRIELRKIQATPIVCLYLITVLTRLIRISVTGFNFGMDRSQLGDFQAFDQWIGYLEDMRWLALAIAGVKVFRGEWRLAVFASMSVLEIAYAFTSGFMKPLLWLIIIISMVAVYAGVRIRRRMHYFAIAAALALLIVPMTEAVRQDFAKGGFDARSATGIMEGVVRGFRSSWGSGFDVGWDMFKKKMLGRQAIVSHMPGIIMSLTPSSYEYFGYDQLLFAFPSSIVPRALWPSKPELTRGVWFSFHYLNIPESIQTSSAITIFGECYMYRGWPAEILMMFGLGIFLACLFTNTVAQELAPLYISIVPTLDVEGQVTTMVLALTQRLIIALLVCWLLMLMSSRPAKRRRHKSVGLPTHHGSESAA